MYNNSRDIIRTSGVAFGTSGARGLVSDFSPRVCAAFTINFLIVAAKKFNFTHVALAIDNRPSSYAMAQACASAMKLQGVTPLFFGVIPTPALAYYALEHNMPAIMVTGSHIPYDRNGLKFYRPDGEITKEDELAILETDAQIAQELSLDELIASVDAKNLYLERYQSCFRQDVLKGLRIGIYEHSSAGRDLYTELFQSLGAEVISLGRSDDFVPIDTEAVSVADRMRAVEWTKAYQLDALFSTDGDGDRPLLSDENGEWLRGDILGLLCSSLLAIDAVAIPVSCNSAIAKNKAFKHVELTRIGSPYVIEAFGELAAKFNRIAGFEANGGYLLGSDITVGDSLLKALPTRDAVLPALTLLAAGEKISRQVANLSLPCTASDRIQDFSPQRSQHLLSMLQQDPHAVFNQWCFEDFIPAGVNLTDGVRITLVNGNIIHLRPSGNAPELRCYAESSTLKQAESLVSICLSKIKLYF